MDPALPTEPLLLTVDVLGWAAGAKLRFAPDARYRSLSPPQHIHCQ